MIQPEHLFVAKHNPMASALAQGTYGQARTRVPLKSNCPFDSRCCLTDSAPKASTPCSARASSCACQACRVRMRCQCTLGASTMSSFDTPFLVIKFFHACNRGKFGAARSTHEVSFRQGPSRNTGGGSRTCFGCGTLALVQVLSFVPRLRTVWILGVKTGCLSSRSPLTPTQSQRVPNASAPR